jgi:hypothetical protein
MKSRSRGVLDRPFAGDDSEVASLAMTGLKNEHRQLIKRIGDFEADQNQRGDHQIKAEMHERLETKYFCVLRDLAKDANQIHCVSGHTSVRQYCRMQLEQKASAAAEVMP